MAKHREEHSVKLCQTIGCSGPYKSAIVLCNTIYGIVGQSLLYVIVAYTVIGCSRQYRHNHHNEYNKISSVLNHNLFLGLATTKLRKKIFRVGHIGNVDKGDYDRLVSALREIVEEYK